jgi:hypothetical protein
LHYLDEPTSLHFTISQDIFGGCFSLDAVVHLCNIAESQFGLGGQIYDVQPYHSQKKPSHAFDI